MHFRGKRRGFGPRLSLARGGDKLIVDTP